MLKRIGYCYCYCYRTVRDTTVLHYQVTNTVPPLYEFYTVVCKARLELANLLLRAGASKSRV